MSSDTNSIIDITDEEEAIEPQAPQIDLNRGQTGLSNKLKCHLLWHDQLLEKKDPLAKLLEGKRDLFGIERRQVRPRILFQQRCRS